MGEARQFGDRNPGKLEGDIFVIDSLRLVIGDDRRGPNLPERWLFRLFRAGLAGGVEAVIERGPDPGLAAPGRRTEAAAVRRHDQEVAHEPFRKRVGHIDARCGDDGPGRLDKAHRARRRHPACLSIIGDGGGGQLIATVIHLDRA